MGDARLHGISSTVSKTWSKSHQSRFHNLLDTGFLSDLHITVGDVVFKTHKVIVATGSPILYEKICKEIISSGHEFLLKQEDLDPKIFHAFLKFLYTGVTSDLRVDQALPLVQLAVAYRVPDLEEKCNSLLSEELTDDNAIRIYQQAVHYKDHTDVLDKSLSYVCRNAWSIVESKEFSDLVLPNLKRLLASEKLLVLNENQLIQGLFRWATKECERRHCNPKESILTTMGELSPWIRWDRIDTDRFNTQDAIELEKFINTYSTLEDKMIPKRHCKLSRKYFEDDFSSYVMSRFPHKFAYCTDNKNMLPEVIKFKTDTTICLLSIGIPAYSQTCEDFFNVKLEIWEGLDVLPGSGKMIVIAEKVPHTKEIYHLSFPKPYKIKRDAWYTVSGTITGTPGYGNMGGKSVQHMKCGSNSNELETNVKFEFKSGGQSCSSTEEVSSGQIDEFCFKLVDEI